ncbi:two-component system, response regulator YesN [Amphibacillus marinus]|uniref:Two-component system, response regulator YesN n=1 Tax=Amphibacillus marinus TaxID=872970 RepID=A0A1H8QF09_9BACI|nr:response regulator transcription factor [Amphibacillus marinus]SEO52636.1 two-component system, response regulator YesN [Amphibacillus marinus]
MYKVLLIDDEPIIREGMRHVIEWETYNFSVIADCANGRDGLHAIRTHNPELVFVDIRMPGMSGIELIQQAKQEGYQGRFVVLSGYSSFSYAREAIKLGIHSYLLKPIDEDELIEILREIKVQIEKEQKISSQLTAYYDMTEEEAWKAVIEGRIDDWQRSHYLQEQIGPFQLASISVAANVKHLKARNKLFGHEQPSAKIVLKDQLIYLLYVNTAIPKIQEELKILLQHIRLEFDRHAYACLSTPYQKLAETTAAISQLQQVKNKVYSFSAESIFQYPIVSTKSYESLSGLQLAEKIVQIIEFKDQKSLKQTISATVNHFRALALDKEKVQAEILELALSIAQGFHQQYPNVKLLPKHEWVDIIYQYDHLQTLMERLFTEWWALSDQIMGFAVSSDNSMERIISYIDHYYHQDLSLKILADLFNYNSSYLGKKFKKHTGEYFHIYLENVRIEKAKELLVDRRYKVYEVSEQVGYSNMDYFYKKFKKQVGMSPKEYQKHILQAE